MRLFSNSDLANTELAERGGWLVQTATYPVEIWCCGEDRECIQLLTESGFSRGRARAIVEEHDENENWHIDAAQLVEDHVRPMQGLQQVGPSADWVNPAWLLAGDIQGDHTVLYETDDNEYIIIERTHPNGPDEDHHHEE